MKRIVRRMINFMKRRSPKIYYPILSFYHKISGFTQNYAQVLIDRYEREKHTEAEKNEFAKACYKNVYIAEAASKAKELRKLLRKVKINSVENKKFFYSIDVYSTWHSRGALMVNSTLDYEKVIYSGLKDLYINDGDGTRYVRENNMTVDAVIEYVNKCIKYIEKKKIDNSIEICKWLRNMVVGEATSLDEALQRILFINMIQWQTEHRLVGLGRLDKTLDKIIKKENKSKEEISESIEEFLKVLHSYYWYKSDALMGDTGQIIILGGNTPNGYFSNELTYVFIEKIEKLQLPDPKILLRVGKDIPDALMELALECIKTGVGSPLLSNDEQVIPKMIDFGYEEVDAYNYVTSACWEPLVPAIAHEQNNIGLINFLLPFQLISEKEGYSEICDMNTLLEHYCNHLRGHIWYICNLLNSINWAEDPIVSMYTESCRINKVDVSRGGGKYNNYGILSVALANAVNAFAVINKYVFEEQKFTLRELDYYRQNNFRGHEDIRIMLKNTEKIFGKDKKEYLKFINYILDVANDEITKYRNVLGGKYKFGLSSPGYITASKEFPASFDGRKACEPFSVHISAEGNNSYIELMQFASKLDYTKAKFNGNVVDYFVTPNFIENNSEKFLKFLKATIEMGVFQMQINVVNSQTLIAARNNPEDYPDLIVRVWGFSAYYVELPDEYKELLIERAIQSEKAS